ncbi:hypothetical protein SXCC_00246 [Gluconacetobacter sp. SXCC-1]|nr:hypothetical protein SXCC_00246 [Gluconacetobacter sp. SXCC-1]
MLRMTLRQESLMDNRQIRGFRYHASSSGFYILASSDSGF